jgi:hypothetical protein
MLAGLAMIAFMSPPGVFWSIPHQQRMAQMPLM